MKTFRTTPYVIFFSLVLSSFVFSSDTDSYRDLTNRIRERQEFIKAYMDSTDTIESSVPAKDEWIFTIDSVEINSNHITSIQARLTNTGSEPYLVSNWYLDAWPYAGIRIWSHDLQHCYTMKSTMSVPDYCILGNEIINPDETRIIQWNAQQTQHYEMHLCSNIDGTTATDSQPIIFDVADCYLVDGFLSFCITSMERCNSQIINVLSSNKVYTNRNE